MTKIAICKSYGVFSLSPVALDELNKRGLSTDCFCSNVKVEIPDDVKDWYITEYDWMETIREGRSWG